MTRLSININKVALLRNQRDLNLPNPVKAADTLLDAGADGITVHPRPDERHIRRDDVPNLSAMMHEQGWFSKGRELNIEGYPSAEFIELIQKIKPDQVTLVPDAPDARTSDHGWNIKVAHGLLKDAIAKLAPNTRRISLFLDAEEAAEPMQQQIEAAAGLGVQAVELYTEPYARHFNQPNHAKILACYQLAAKLADQAGLQVNAGHDLNLDNLKAFKHAIIPLAEVSIGHAFTSDSLWMGMVNALNAYRSQLEEK